MKARIERVDNGYVVYDHNDDIMVFEDDGGEFGELISFVGAVQHLQDLFGNSGSKHDKKRIQVAVLEKAE